MPRSGFAILCLIFLVGAGAVARAQMNDRLQSEHYGSIPIGEYQAGDNLHFSLVRDENATYSNVYLLHIAGQPEVYVLYADFGTLGGQVLKYDSGAIAIQITGWGGMTIYTDDQPQGIAASRSGEATAPSPAPVSLSQMQSAAEDESSHLAYSRGLHLSFAADWNVLASDAPQRALAFDAMENAARGIDRFSANPAARNVFLQRVSAVHMTASDKPVIRLDGHTLIVTFNPRQGYQGRASSRAISFALGKLFSVPIPN